jgi:hypothetical protein
MLAGAFTNMSCMARHLGADCSIRQGACGVPPSAAFLNSRRISAPRGRFRVCGHKRRSVSLLPR